MVTFHLFQMRVREPFYLMYGFCHEWSGYQLTNQQACLMHRFSDAGRDRETFYQIGIKLARGIKAGTAKTPEWLVIEKEVATC
jgi:hypothetical protein